MQDDSPQRDPVAASMAAISICGLLYRDPLLWGDVRIGAEHMPDAATTALFQALRALNQRGTEPDPATLEEELARRGASVPDEDILELPTIGFAPNLDEYQRILLREHRLAGLAVLQRRLADLVERGDVEEATVQIDRFLSDAPAEKPRETTKDILLRVFAKIENPEPALATGLEPWDGMLDGGLRAGEVHVVAARPGVGKSALALQVILRACGQGTPVALWSLEMSPDQWLRRALAQEARVPMKAIRTGKLHNDDYVALAQAAGVLTDLPLHFADGFDTTPEGFRIEATRLVRQHKVGLLVVDYLQLMQPDRKAQSREQEVARVSRTIKRTALDLAVPVLLVAQVSREADDRVPTLRHLRESGAIEQDADAVLFLHRERDEDTQVLKEMGLAVLAKQRDGETGAFPLYYASEHYAFTAVEGRLAEPEQPYRPNGNGRRHHAGRRP